MKKVLLFTCCDNLVTATFLSSELRHAQVRRKSADRTSHEVPLFLSHSVMRSCQGGVSTRPKRWVKTYGYSHLCSNSTVLENPSRHCSRKIVFQNNRFRKKGTTVLSSLANRGSSIWYLWYGSNVSPCNFALNIPRKHLKANLH